MSTLRSLWLSACTLDIIADTAAGLGKSGETTLDVSAGRIQVGNVMVDKDAIKDIGSGSAGANRADQLIVQRRHRLRWLGRLYTRLGAADNADLRLHIRHPLWII